MTVKTKSRIKKEKVKEVSLTEYIDKIGEIASERKQLEGHVKELKKQEENIKNELLEKGLIEIGETYRGKEHTLKTFKYVTTVVNSLKAAKIVKERLGNTDFNKIFSDIFNLNKTKAKKYLSEKDLMGCVTDEKMDIRFKVE